MFIKATFSQIQRKLSSCARLMYRRKRLWALGFSSRREQGWGGAKVQFPPSVPCERARIPSPTHWPPCGRLCTASAGSPGSTGLLHCTRAGCDPPARTAPLPGSWSSHSAAAHKEDTGGWDTPQLHGHPTVGTRKFWEVAICSFHQGKGSQPWHFLVTPTGQATSSWHISPSPGCTCTPRESELWCLSLLEVLEDNGI